MRTSITAVSAALLWSACHSAAALAATPGAVELVARRGKIPPATATSRGRWRIEPGRVAPPVGRGQARTSPYWVAGGAELVDGTVRARLRRRRGRLDLTLLLRGKLDREGRLVDGYGLRIGTDRGYFVRLRRGHPARVGGIHYLLGMRAQRRIEVVVQMFGRHLVAAIFDGRLRRRLAALTLEVHRAGTGATLGLLAGPRNHPDVALVGLSARRACAAPLLSLPDPPRLFIGVDGRTAAKAASRGAGVVVERRRLRPAGGEVDEVIYRSDTTRLERLVCGGARVLSVSALRPWKYLVGDDYLALRDRPPPTDASGRLVIHRSYKHPRMVTALLRAWHRLHPKRTRLEQLGRSHQGRPLQALFIGDRLRKDDPRPTALLVGGHHGTEPLSVEIVLDAISTLLEGPDDGATRRILRELVVCAVPVINPDGLHGYLEVSHLMGRKNGRDDNHDGLVGVYEGVDLNRNYPYGWRARVSGRDTRRRDWHYYRGPAPASEPEVKAMMGLAARERFVAAASYHSGAIALHVPYTVRGKRSPYPDAALVVARQLARKLGRHPQGRRFALRRTIADVSGSDQDHYRHAHGTLALVVEAARKTPRRLEERRAVIAALRPSWRALLRRYLDGPSITGHVRDERGRSVTAEVRVLEIALREGERWSTRRRDGRYDRYLPAPGRYRVRASAPGFAPQLKVVDVGRRQRARLDFTLTPAR